MLQDRVRCLVGKIEVDDPAGPEFIIGEFVMNDQAAGCGEHRDAVLAATAQRVADEIVLLERIRVLVHATFIKAAIFLVKRQAVAGTWVAFRILLVVGIVGFVGCTVIFFPNIGDLGIGLALGQEDLLLVLMSLQIALLSTVV